MRRVAFVEWRQASNGAIPAMPKWADCCVFERRTETRTNRGHGHVRYDQGPRVATMIAAWAYVAVLGAGAGCSSLSWEHRRDKVISAREISQRGMEAYQAGNWQGAEVLFRQAVDVCPADERVRSRYADILWHRGARAEAIEHMDEAVRLSGGEPDLLVRLGEMHLAESEVRQASELADRAIRFDPRWVRAQKLKGDCLRREDRWREALAAYHLALSIQSHYPEARMAIAQIYHEHGRPERALSTLQALASELAPDEAPPELEYWQGIVSMSLGRYKDAIAHLTRAESRGWRTAELLYCLAEAHHRMGDESAARLAWNQALQLQPQHAQAQHAVPAVDQERRMANLPD